LCPKEDGPMHKPGVSRNCRKNIPGIFENEKLHKLPLETLTVSKRQYLKRFSIDPSSLQTNLKKFIAINSSISSPS
jgi:hypothetical protein